ncbi:hypothetical protein Tco_0097922 [Tanacetum coccineum]
MESASVSDEGPSIHKDRSRGTKVFDGRSIGLKGSIKVIVVVKWNDRGRGGIREGIEEKGVKRPSCTLCSMGELGRVENTRALGANGETLIVGEDSIEEMSMTFVLANFLRGFLVDDEALEAIFLIRMKKEVVDGFSQIYETKANQEVRVNLTYFQDFSGFNLDHFKEVNKDWKL